MNCPFCQLPSEHIRHNNEHAIAIRDGYPISAGHTLIILKRHVGSFFETTNEERSALLQLLDQARDECDQQTPKPDAYNIGINDGSAAGQTVPHLHIHLIPRYKGDSEDPRGGVRWIMPKKAKYWP